MTDLTFPDLNASHEIDFGGGLKVQCLPVTSIQRDQAVLRSYGLIRDFADNPDAMLEELGIPGEQVSELAEASPLGFARYIQSVLTAVKCFTGWEGPFQTATGVVDLKDVDLTPANISVFCLKHQRAQRFENFMYSEEVVAEGNA